MAKFNEALQNNDFETAIGYYSQVVNKDENQMRDLDKILVEKFNTLIGNCTFDLATKNHSTHATLLRILRTDFQNAYIRLIIYIKY